MHQLVFALIHIKGRVALWTKKVDQVKKFSMFEISRLKGLRLKSTYDNTELQDTSEEH